MARNELPAPSYSLHKIPTTPRLKHSLDSMTVISPMTYTTSQSTDSSSTSTHMNPYALNQTFPADYNEDGENIEYRLPSIKSLIVVLASNALFQLSFFSVVPSAHKYFDYLCGTSTFSGLIIGVSTVFTGIALPIVKRFDGGQYRRPFAVAYIASVIGNILFALAYSFNSLYLLLLARMISGISFTSFMFSRKYCNDPRLVGIRRRSTLASWYTFGQAFGFSVGPLIGGLFYEIGFEKSSLFNGLTALGWVISGMWLVFWVVSSWFFQDVPETSNNTFYSRPAIGELEMNATEGHASDTANDLPPSFFALTSHQKCLLICMCYYSVAFFFVLSGWELYIPVLTEYAWGYSPYQSGKFIAMGASATFPFLLANARYAYRIEDRLILVTGTLLGLLGLIIHFSSWLTTNMVHFWPLLLAWFLVALGFTLANTCTISLVSKQMPGSWNENVFMAIQYSNYAGRVAGAVMGGAGVKIGMEKYVGIQIAVIGLGIIMHLFLWTEFKAKTG